MTPREQREAQQALTAAMTMTLTDDMQRQVEECRLLRSQGHTCAALRAQGYPAAAILRSGQEQRTSERLNAAMGEG